MAKSQSKYRNVPTVVDGIRFDSKKEAKRYSELKLMEKAKLITKIDIHPRFRLEVNGEKICDYVADFGYLVRSGENDEKMEYRLAIEDVKGVKTAVYRIKKKLMKACLGIEVVEV